MSREHPSGRTSYQLLRIFSSFVCSCSDVRLKGREPSAVSVALAAGWTRLRQAPHSSVETLTGLLPFCTGTSEAESQPCGHSPCPFPDLCPHGTSHLRARSWHALNATLMTTGVCLGCSLPALGPPGPFLVQSSHPIKMMKPCFIRQSPWLLFCCPVHPDSFQTV